jgi:hypothetical protein
VAAHLRAADDGWHQWHDDVPEGDEPPVTVRVRLGEGDDGRLHLVEMHVDGELSAEVLRSIPVGRIEAAANAQLHPSASAPLGLDLASAFGDDALGDDDVFPSGAGSFADAVLPPALRDSAGGGYRDEFYGAVAAIYRSLAASTPRPVAEMAGANDVPVTTAQRWVKEARRRGLLAPGRPGKAG